MKMKLAQRIAIGYYKTKIKTIALVSKRKAAQKAFELFCTPYSGKPKRKAPAVFHKAEKVSFDFEGITVRGWRWQSDHPNGKKILIAHGFDSYSYRFEKYINPLTRAGFEVLAFDAPGHGISNGKTINVLVYKQTILQIEKQFGSLFAIIAHSLGGMAAALATEEIPTLQKLVLIAPATETSTAIKNFFTFFPVGNDIQEEMEKLIVEMRGYPISYYSVSRSIKNIHIPVLWLHDEDDWICTYEDVKPVQQYHLPNVEFYITKGLGHSKIYRDNSSSKKIIEFVSQ
jgi:pimeloyl-ACP methyl ester carboxylesterase